MRLLLIKSTSTFLWMAKSLWPCAAHRWPSPALLQGVHIRYHLTLLQPIAALVPRRPSSFSARWGVTFWIKENMGVSENSGTPKSSILIGFSIINHPFWGYPDFWKHPYLVLPPRPPNGREGKAAFFSMICFVTRWLLICSGNGERHDWSIEESPGSTSLAVESPHFHKTKNTKNKQVCVQVW